MTEKQFATENANKYFYGGANSSHWFYGLGTNEIAGKIVGYCEDVIMFIGSPAIIAAYIAMNNCSPRKGIVNKKTKLTGTCDADNDFVFGRKMNNFGRIINSHNKRELEKLIKALEL